MQKSALPPNPASVSPQMPGELAAIILRCLAKNPLDRIASARELEEALDRITEAF
ncbi:MAG: hypothetical protein IFK93_11505 [Acidobacteria bacterium]|nr:hypothetical protein [Candidatus Sulfomarinibacter kjeldsenii]